MSVSSAPFRGVCPAIMTPWTEDGQPDYERLVSVAVSQIAYCMQAVVWPGSMGNWSDLSDEERKTGVELLCEAGINVIVGTGHKDSFGAWEMAAHAQEVGAAGLMMIPKQLAIVNCAATQEVHFSGILEAAPNLPAVIYNSPYYGFETKADLFFRLREERKHLNLIGYKEFGGAAALTYAAQNITAGNDDLILSVGVDTQVTHGFMHCGAQGAITGIGNVLPEQVLRLVELSKRFAKDGDPQAMELATALERALMPLSLYDEGPHLVQYYKYLMTLVGHENFDRRRRTKWGLAPGELSSSQRADAESQLKLFLAWWNQWDGRSD